jgi:hypothetical protein
LPRIWGLRLAVNQRAILTTLQRPILTSILWLSNGFFALFEAERIVVSFDDVTMVGNTVEQGSTRGYEQKCGEPHAASEAFRQ